MEKNTTTQLTEETIRKIIREEIRSWWEDLHAQAAAPEEKVTEFGLSSSNRSDQEQH